MMVNQRTFLAVPIAILTLLLAIACGPSAAPTTAPGATAKPGAATAGDPGRGKQAYDATCTGCHGPDAKGLPGLGKDLTASTFVKGQTDAQLVDFIKKGRPASDPANTTKIDMPPKGGNPALADAQIVDIVAYVRTLQK